VENELKKKFKTFLVMTLGCVFIAVGVYFFKIPNGFVTGGVTGIATLLAPLTSITAGAWIWILNVSLLILGFIFLGNQNTIKTVYCSMLYSAITFILEKVVPLTEPLSNQPLMELVYAMLLTSFGAALLFNSNASSGGTDIVALILKKYTSLNVGKSLLIVDFIVAASSFFVYGIVAGLFSLLGLFAKAFLVDTVIENLNTYKYFIVITSEGDEISQYVMNTLHRGVTLGKVIGAYTKEEITMIHTVCKRLEAVRLRDEIKKIDPHAFIIVTTSSEIIGRGFRAV